MRNNKSIVNPAQNVKHGSNLHVVRREDYKDIAGMSTSAPKAKNERDLKRKRTVQPGLSDLELARFERVAARYQRIAGVKNPNKRCNIENTDLVYGALIALERTVSDEDFYKCIVDGLGRR